MYSWIVAVYGFENTYIKLDVYEGVGEDTAIYLSLIEWRGDIISPQDYYYKYSDKDYYKSYCEDKYCCEIKTKPLIIEYARKN